MDRNTRLRGGSSLWSDESSASIIVNTDFFTTPVTGNIFWLKVAGVWKQTTAFIKIAGIWKQCQINIKAVGTWH